MAGEMFCMECFSLIPGEARSCPACGRAIADSGQRSYQEKLVRALHHPLGEVRMRAILALGLLGNPGAAQPLAECALRHPIGIIEGLEVVASLQRLCCGPEPLEALEKLSRCHPAAAVRRAAKKTLEELC